MKHVILFIGVWAIVVISSLISCSSSKNAVNNADPVTIRQSLDSGNWVFTVSNILPQGSRSRQPNGVYTVSYTPQELNVYLPYFGRAYTGADAFTGRDPLDFSAKDFEIQKQRMKDDKWRFVFKPRTEPQIQSMTFEIYDNGAATLDVILTNRSPISYRGNASVKK